MFRSFFLAGFEGSTGYNRHGQWFDQVATTGHDRTVDHDYSELARLGIHGARECVRWPLVDRGVDGYDFSSVDPFIEAARRHRIDVIWDLFHYGYPLGLDLLGPEFPKRFVDYCHAAARYICERSEGRCWFTPVNEPSFFAYAAGEKGLFAPHLTGQGPALKVALCGAAIRAIEAIWDAAAGCRIVSVDPLCRVTAPEDRPDIQDRAKRFNDCSVFESWDIISGRILPELGGSPDHLDIVGINYYWTNQWELEGPAAADGTIEPLADDDPRRLSLADLVRIVWERYGQDMIISETAHVGDQRGPWLRHVAAEAETLLEEGIPLHGLCLYPILGMPEWHAPEIWTPMGLWDPVSHDHPHGDRLICEDMLDALTEARHLDALAERLRDRRDAAPTRRKAVSGGRRY